MVGVIHTISGGYVGNLTPEPSQAKEKEQKKMRVKGKITFFDAELEGIKYPHDNPIVVTLNILSYDVHYILIDNKSFMEVLFYDAFVRMSLPHNHLRRMDSHLVGFSCNTIPIEGVVFLPVTIG